MAALTGGNVQMAIRNVRRNKMRSLLTMLGVIIGVMSVVLVVGIGQGIKNQVDVQTEHLGKDLITIRPGQTMTHTTTGLLNAGGAIAGLGLRTSGTLSENDVTTVAKTTDVAGAAPLSLVNSGVVSSEHSGTYNNMLIIGTNQQFAGMVRQGLAYGAFFDDTATSAFRVVIGSSVAQQLFDEQVPLGQTLTVLGHQFVVTGIFNSFQTTPLSTDADFNNSIFIPYQTAQAITNSNTPIYEILARPSHPLQTDTAASSITTALLTAHGGQHDFTVLKQSQTMAVTDKILHLLTLLIGGVAAIALLVGGVGIMNVMLVSVAERMHEIGIRKALGATNRQIITQFIIEATVLSVTGGLVGIIASFVVEGIIDLLTTFSPDITWQVVALAFSVSIGVGIIFGSVPAAKAARKEPIAALRNE